MQVHRKNNSGGGGGGGSGSSKRQVGCNFLTDKQRKTSEGVKPPNQSPGPPQDLH